MKRLAEDFLDKAWEDDFLVGALRRAIGNLEAQGLDIYSITADDMMDINRRYADKGWYALHPHYGHERFIGILTVNRESGEVCSIIGARPLELGDKSLGDALADLSYVYPFGVPAGVADKFVDIPRQAYFLRGHGLMVGGLWINPREARRSGLGGSDLLSYMVKMLWITSLLKEDPDFIIFLATDRIVRGHGTGRSIIDRYDVRYLASGPTWENHYPDGPEKDLKLNLGWADRAGLSDTILKADWAIEGGLEEEARLSA